MINKSVDEVCQVASRSELVVAIKHAYRHSERVELPKGLRRDEAYRLAMKSTGAFSPRCGYTGIPTPVIEVRGGWAQALDYRKNRYTPTLIAKVIRLDIPKQHLYQEEAA